MQNKIENLRERAETGLRKVCGKVSPDRRIAVIVALFSLFAVVNIWVVSSAIFNIGREGEHFEKIELPDVYAPVTDTLPEADSLQLALEKFFNENFNIEGHDSSTEQ